MSISDYGSNADWWKGEKEKNKNGTTLLQLFTKSAVEKNPGEISICLIEILKKSSILQKLKDNNNEKGRKKAAIDAICEAACMLENNYNWEEEKINQLKKYMIILVKDL